MTAWMEAARGELGVSEKRGAIHNPRILEYFLASGHGWVKDDETAWCAAFVGWCLAFTGVKGSGSLAARSYLSWGRKLKRGKPGAIVVFKRGSSSWQGHVGFYISETPTHVRVLGGNQGNKVSIRSYSKKKLLGYRWPSTMAGSRTVKASVAGSASTFGSFALDQAQEALPLADQAGEFMEMAKYVGFALSLLAFGLAMYFRYDDIKKKGR